MRLQVSVILLPLLTLKAKGILFQMLSMLENWDYTLQGLSIINREKLEAIREAVKELEHARLHDIDVNAPKDEQTCVDKRSRENGSGKYRLHRMPTLRA